MAHFDDSAPLRPNATGNTPSPSETPAVQPTDDEAPSQSPEASTSNAANDFAPYRDAEDLSAALARAFEAQRPYMEYGDGEGLIGRMLELLRSKPLSEELLGYGALYESRLTDDDGERKDDALPGLCAEMIAIGMAMERQLEQERQRIDLELELLRERELKQSSAVPENATRQDAWLTKLYGPGPRPKRIRHYKTMLRETPHPGIPADAIGQRGRVPFITPFKREDRTYTEYNFWNPGQPPVGMSEKRWGVCMATAFMEWIRVEELAGSGRGLGSHLMFIRYALGKQPFTSVETGFWGHLGLYLRAASIAHESQQQLAGMAALDGAKRYDAVFALLRRDRVSE